MLITLLNRGDGKLTLFDCLYLHVTRQSKEILFRAILLLNLIIWIHFCIL